MYLIPDDSTYAPDQMLHTLDVMDYALFEHAKFAADNGLESHEIRRAFEIWQKQNDA